MASVELLDPVVKPETSSETLSRQVEEQVAEVVERVEGSQAVGPRTAGGWFYQVPFPGVRYYSF